MTMDAANVLDGKMQIHAGETSLQKSSEKYKFFGQNARLCNGSLNTHVEGLSA